MTRLGKHQAHLNNQAGWAALAAIMVVHLTACSPSGVSPPLQNKETEIMVNAPPNSADSSRARPADEHAMRDSQYLQIATFGAGCFWCVEAVFQQLEGVISVQSGYSGGTVVNPTYEQICRADTGHAEVCQIQFDPAVISFDDLLEVFWRTHDPTTLNRQGADVGPQYRSVIFYHDEDQKQLAEKRKQQLDQAGLWPNPIVTEISPAKTFYVAEEYHQNYYNNNPTKGYCQVVIRPKLENFRQVFADKLTGNAGN